MTEKELRESMEQKFGALSETIWEDLREQDYVGAAVRQPQPGVRQLEARIRFYQRLASAAPDSPTGRRSVGLSAPAGDARPAEAKRVRRKTRARDRLEVLAVYLARMTWPSSLLRDFRRHYLGDQAIDVEAATRFIRSPALRFLPRELLLKESIPPLEHHAEVLRLVRVDKSEFATDWAVRVRVFFRGRAREYSAGLQICGHATAASAELPLLQFGGIPIDPESISFFPNSPIGDLKRAVAGVIDLYPWPEFDATRLLLTGDIPRIWDVQSQLQHVRSKFHSHNVLTLTVDPRMRADDLKRGYLALQEKHFGRLREPGARNIELFDFVAGRMDDTGGIPDWNALVVEWNRRHGALKRYAHAWRFRRDFDRALSLVAFSREPKPTRANKGTSKS